MNKVPSIKEKVCVWGYNDKLQKWVYRKALSFSNELNRTDLIAPFVEKYGQKHALFSKKFNPNIMSLLVSMKNLVDKKVQSYQNDFYCYDCKILSNYKGPFIWIVRHAGTNFVSLNERTEEEINGSMTILDYYMTHDAKRCIVYLCDTETGEIKKSSFEKAKQLLSSVKIVEPAPIEVA